VPGSIFIGFLWGTWIVATFLMHKQNKFRFPLAFLSLVFIIVFPYKVHIAPLSIQVPAIIFLIIGYVYIAFLAFSKRIFMMIAIIIMITGYTGYLLMILYDPVWLILDYHVMTAILIFLIAQILYPKSLFSHLVCSVLGTIQGEIVYGVILSKWEFTYNACSGDYLDICAIYFFITLTWFFIQHISSNMSLKNSVGKQKHG